MAQKCDDQSIEAPRGFFPPSGIIRSNRTQCVGLVMSVLQNIRQEEGYTLLETLVAMALFVGVLIPVGASMGNLMVQTTTDQLNAAFHLAAKEMNHTTLERDF